MKLLKYPDPFLFKIAKPLEKIDEEVTEKVEEMFEVMYREGGAGLAAPQVGWGVRLFIIGSLPGKADRDRSGGEVYINPVIYEAGKKLTISKEGCLSIPNRRYRVIRSEGIFASYYDLSGERRLVEMHTPSSMIFQHENDHLDGVLILKREEESKEYLSTHPQEDIVDLDDLDEFFKEDEQGIVEGGESGETSGDS